MTIDDKIARLYRDACGEDARFLAEVDPSDLIDLAQGRLAGGRRARLVAAIAASPSLAAAYRLARASADWSTTLAADLRGERAGQGNVRALPVRPARTGTAAVRRRHPFAMAAAVGAMAVGALFVSQRLQTPATVDDGFAGSSHQAAEDRILATSFGSEKADDVIFSTRADADSDRIFAFGKGS